MTFVLCFDLVVICLLLTPVRGRGVGPGLKVIFVLCFDLLVICVLLTPMSGRVSYVFITLCLC